ncbi:DUF6898 family protein [Emcibacter sp.]|uniref:DUF6898 family protein n=1 Tax=Emcibacter sp. TaxID=1979954 RepID=UPI002AA7269E|nr:hypothetical protein [Emcibacter sp.]
MTSVSDGDIIVEFVQVGNSVKVSAIDTRSGREVSIVGSPRTSQTELKRVAINKLKYVLSKE